MAPPKCFLVGLLVVVVGCMDRPPAPDAAETLVRAVIAERLNVDASEVPMDKPISDPPMKADDLDLVEIVMDLEERHGVEITDAAIERYLGGKFGESPPRITPNQLATLVRDAAKIQQLTRKK